MSYNRVLIEIDDRDRDNAPEMPWAAHIMQWSDLMEGVDPHEAGIGVTIPEALRDLADAIEREMAYSNLNL